MMKQGRRHENDDSGMALRPDGPPTASSRAVVVPGTQTGREHQLPSYRYSRQRRGYKLKARQARTEAEKCHPRASSQYSYQQSRDKHPGRQSPCRFRQGWREQEDHRRAFRNRAARTKCFRMYLASARLAPTSSHLSRLRSSPTQLQRIAPVLRSLAGKCS